MKLFFLYLWQLPQTLLAFILRAFFLKDIKEKLIFNGRTVYKLNHPSIGVSLGEFIFIVEEPDYYWNLSIHHEYGHSRQSRILGPLYLIVVGLPSVIMNILSQPTINILSANNYYNRFPENWADSLGGIKHIGTTRQL